MEKFSGERISLCLLVGAVMLTFAYGASVAGVQRRQIEFQAETTALQGLNRGLRAARTLAQSLIPLPQARTFVDVSQRKAFEDDAMEAMEALVEAMDLRDMMEEVIRRNTSAEIVALHAVIEAVLNESCKWLQQWDRFADLGCSREEQLELRVRFQAYRLVHKGRLATDRYTTTLHQATAIPRELISMEKESQWLEENVMCVPVAAQQVISRNYQEWEKPTFHCAENL